MSRSGMTAFFTHASTFSPRARSTRRTRAAARRGRTISSRSVAPRTRVECAMATSAASWRIARTLTGLAGVSSSPTAAASAALRRRCSWRTARGAGSAARRPRLSFFTFGRTTRTPRCGCTRTATSSTRRSTRRFPSRTLDPSPLASAGTSHRPRVRSRRTRGGAASRPTTWSGSRVLARGCSGAPTIRSRPGRCARSTDRRGESTIPPGGT